MQTETNNKTSLQKLHDEIDYFVDTIAAPDASDGILNLLMDARARESLNPKLTEALYGVMFLINAIDRVQRELAIKL